MKRSIVLHILLTAALVSTNSYAKPKALPDATEAKWILSVKNHRTKDGSTVAEVLAFAHRERPEKFKSGSFEVGYDGETGEPDTVGIEYWIGNRRSADDAFVDLSYPMTRRGQVSTPAKESLASSLEGGKTEFLRAVDDTYKTTCRPDSRAPADC